MKIENGKVNQKDETMMEMNLRHKLKTIFEEWFNLKEEDIPEVIEKMGVSSKSYEIILCEDRTSILQLSLMVKTDTAEEYFVDFMSGGMVMDPNPYVKVSCNGEEKTFEIRRTIQVNFLS